MTARIRFANLQRAHPIPRRRAARLVARLLDRFRVREGEVSVAFVSAARMRALNRRYHHRDRATDVLAFDLRRPSQRRRRYLAGDVVIAPSVAARHAVRYGQTYTEELLTYVAHGLLHLLGFRDHTAAGRARMDRWQRMFVSE